MIARKDLENQGAPYWIPNTKRADLPEFFKRMGFKKGVEIGVSWGQNIVDYCKAGLEIYGIDPWEDSEEIPYRKIISIPGEYGQTVCGVYRLAKERTEKYPNCKLIRKRSIDAAKDFANRSLDFVYIDASHDFKDIATDLAIWCHKVKKGGVIAGHDYYSTRNIRQIRYVRYIVDAFAKAYDFENFWVLGTPEDKEKDDELSYFFIKHW